MSKTKTNNNFNTKKTLLIFLTIILLSLVFLNFNNIGPIMDFNSITTKDSKAGEELILESKKGEFMADVGNSRFYSKKENGTNIIQLPKNNQEGNYEYKQSSFINLGFTKIKFNDKKISVFKDYQPPTITSFVPKLVESKDFKVNFKRDSKPFILTLNDKQVYDSTNNNDICSKTNDIVFVCNLKINSTEEIIKLIATDENGNITNIFDGPIKYVDPLSLDCNQTKIEDEGIIECKTNRKVKYSIEVDGKNETKDNSDIFIFKIENQENKKYPISVKVEDENGLKKEIIQDYEVDRGVFDAKMWVVKTGDNPYNTVYNVYAWANKDADFEAMLYETIHEYDNINGKQKQYPGRTQRAKVFARSDIPANQEILVKSDKLVITGCVDICHELNYEIKMYSIKNPNKQILYTCSGVLGNYGLSKCNKK